MLNSFGTTCARYTVLHYVILRGSTELILYGEMPVSRIVSTVYCQNLHAIATQRDTDMGGPRVCNTISKMMERKRAFSTQSVFGWKWMKELKCGMRSVVQLWT